MLPRVDLWLLVRWSRCALLDPRSKQRDLRNRQWLSFTRHAFRGIRGDHAFEKNTLRRIAGRDHRTGVASPQHQLDRVDPQTGPLFQRAMTGEATLPENRCDLFQIVDASLRGTTDPRRSANRNDENSDDNNNEGAAIFHFLMI